MWSADERVFTVVLNYRHVSDTLRCLESVRRSTYRNQSLIVVDNGSTPDTAAQLTDALPATAVLTSTTNLGYAGGNNLGIRRALERGADFVWLLNPDVTVEPETLERLVAVAAERPRAGIIGSRIVYGGSRPATIWHDGGVIDWDRGGATSHLNDGRRVREVAPGQPYAVDYVTGAGMLVRREVFEDVGLLPEHYFLYFEETAFTVCARRHGWDALVEPRSTMAHYKRSTGRLPTPSYVYYYVRNRILFGVEFGDATVDAVVDDVEQWVDAWRQKVRHREPTWAPVFEELVAQAVDDARRGHTGASDVPAAHG